MEASTATRLSDRKLLCAEAINLSGDDVAGCEVARATLGDTRLLFD